MRAGTILEKRNSKAILENQEKVKMEEEDMKILVYGAGVLGSYLAHELYKGENKVTLLARGKHYEAIKKNGMVINHIRQKQETSVCSTTSTCSS